MLSLVWVREASRKFGVQGRSLKAFKGFLPLATDLLGYVHQLPVVREDVRAESRPELVTADKAPTSAVSRPRGLCQGAVGLVEGLELRGEELTRWRRPGANCSAVRSCPRGTEFLREPGTWTPAMAPQSLASEMPRKSLARPISCLEAAKTPLILSANGPTFLQ